MAATEDDDVEALLQAQATQFERDEEVERVLKAFRLNPFDILDLPHDVPEREVKMRYRKRSLLVHPDKCKHPKAEAAFGALATAQTDALDFGKRSMLTRVYEEAQQRLMEERKLPPDSAETQAPEFRRELRKAANRLLAEIEWEKRKMVQRELEEQGRQAAELEKREEERKRKAEEEKDWEKTRESRVASWRDFQNKKKVKKNTPELRPPKAVVEDASKSFIKRVNRANE